MYITGGCQDCHNENGCRAESDFSYFYRGKRYAVRGCAMKHVGREALYYFNLYNHYKQGYLERPGACILTQSPKYLRAMNLISAVVAGLEEKRNKG